MAEYGSYEARNKLYSNLILIYSNMNNMAQVSVCS